MMVDSFNRLPLEVLITILRYAPDLPTIYKFICASAHANAAFNIDPAYILDAAIERSTPEFKHSARMIAILGTLASSPNLSFKGLVDRYRNLPEDILSTAPASYAFVTGTPGPRYLVLTAYRIEVLQYIAFISLLRNIHEVIWSISPEDGQETYHYPIKQCRTDIIFQAAAWWAPSWVEKMRIVRAYWNLFVYWNIRAISPDLATVRDDWKFSIYRTAIRSINPCVGPHYINAQQHYLSHEIEEMKCVLAATRDFFGFPLDSLCSFSPLTARCCQSSRLRLEQWTFSTVFKENSQWRTEEPKLVETFRANQAGQNRSCISEMNFYIRESHWLCWYHNCLSESFEQDQLLLPPDYLGLCIWDCKRLGYLGLKDMPENCLDPCLGPVRNPTNDFFSSTRMRLRWRAVFLRELLEFPGRRLRPRSKTLDNLMVKWYGTHRI